MSHPVRVALRQALSTVSRGWLGIASSSMLGPTPREFAIDPTGRWLIVGNQDSDSAFVFRRGPNNGLLTNPTRLTIGSPVDFQFTPSS